MRERNELGADVIGIGGSATRPSRLPPQLQPHTAPRRVPLHPKGIATVETILDATATLVAEYGHEAVTTNLIARAAGVNIATLYQYFSSKQSIILALFEQQTSARSKSAKAMLDGMVPGVAWRGPVEAMIDAMATLRATQPGCAAVRLAMRASPELAERERAAHLRVADRLADRMVDLARLPMPRAQLIARCAVEIGDVFLDLWSLEADPSDLTLVDEAKAAVTAYLAPHLDQAA